MSKEAIRERRAVSNLFGMLALFIMLLAFFIIFTADVEFNEERFDRALDGLQTSFPAARIAAAGIGAEQEATGRGQGRSWAATRRVLAEEPGAMQLALSLRETAQGETLVAFLPKSVLRPPADHLLQRRLERSFREVPALRLMLSLKDSHPLDRDYLTAFASRSEVVERLSLSLDSGLPAEHVKLSFTLEASQ